MLVPLECVTLVPGGRYPSRSLKYAGKCRAAELPMIEKRSPYSATVHDGPSTTAPQSRELEWASPKQWPSSCPMTRTERDWLIHACEPPPSPDQLHGMCG